MRSPVPAFRCTGVIPLLWPRFLIPRLTLGSGKAVRSKLDCMHEPPFSPTAAPYPVTIVLSPTRKDTTKRHWQQPLVTGLAERVNVDGAIEFLKWWPDYGYTGRTVFGICALLKPVTRLSSSPTDLTFEKPPPQVVFSFSEQEITRRKKELKKILSMLNHRMAHSRAGRCRSAPESSTNMEPCPSQNSTKKPSFPADKMGIS